MPLTAVSDSMCSCWLFKRGSRVRGWPCIIRPLITTTVLQLNIAIPQAISGATVRWQTFTLIARWGQCDSALIVQPIGLPFMPLWFSLQWSVKRRGERWKRWEGQGRKRERGRNLMEITDKWKSHICTEKLRTTSAPVWKPFTTHLYHCKLIRFLIGAKNNMNVVHCLPSVNLW